MMYVHVCKNVFFSNLYTSPDVVVCIDDVKLSACDATSSNYMHAVSCCVRRERDMGRWVGPPERCKQHVPSFRKTLVGTGWATSHLLCLNGLRE